MVHPVAVGLFQAGSRVDRSDHLTLGRWVLVYSPVCLMNKVNDQHAKRLWEGPGGM